MASRERPRPKQSEFVDDGRVIAAMDPDTMSGNIHRRSARPRLDESGHPLPKPEPVKLTRSERWAISRGVITAFLVLVGVLAVVFFLLVLFATKVWFR